MKLTKTAISFFLLLTLVFSSVATNYLVNPEVYAARSITFPVIGSARFSNDYNAPRGTRTHHAIDILASKGQKLVSVVNGTITRVNYPQPSWGYSVTIRDSDGYKYRYIHMNDDNPGTNDGKGGGMNAYAADIEEGNSVVRGQYIGKVGDSGNSNGVSHLHFEIFRPDGSVVNPYDSLRLAKRIQTPVEPPQLSHEVLPYGASRIGISISTADFDEDPDPELITGAGLGGGPRIKVYEDDYTVLTNTFYATTPTFTGGVDVAAGDVDGDGIDEIITGNASSATPNVRVFERDGTILASFYAYPIEFRGGIKVAAGDVDGDGIDEIITGPNKGIGPRIKVFELDGTLINEFDAFRSSFTGGTDVSAADLGGTDSAEEILVAAGPGGGPHIIARQLDGTLIADFYAYKRENTSGVRISAGDVRPWIDKSEIITSLSGNAPPRLKVFSSSGNLLGEELFIEEWWVGSYDVAAGYDSSKAATGWNRRASIREGIE